MRACDTVIIIVAFVSCSILTIPAGASAAVCPNPARPQSESSDRSMQDPVDQEANWILNVISSLRKDMLQSLSCTPEPGPM